MQARYLLISWHMCKSAVRISVYFMVALGICLAAKLPRAEAVERWRFLAVEARKAASEKNYDKAIDSYHTAIRSALNNANEEILCNLKLCLAETYCKASRFDESAKVLQSINKHIDSIDDKTMQIRYWRRMSDLYFARKEFAESTKASLKAMDVLSLLCKDHNRFLYLKAWEHHLQRLKFDGHYNIADSFLNFARANEQLLKSHSYAHQRFMEELLLCCRALPPAQITFSADQLNYLAQFATPAETLVLWDCFIRGADEFHPLAPHIDQIVDTLRMVPDGAQYASDKLSCQIRLATYFAKSSQSLASSLNVFRKLTRTFKPNDACSPDELAAKNNVSGTLLKHLYDANDPLLNEEKANRLKDLEATSHELMKLPATEKFASKIGEARIWLSYFAIQENRLEEADQLLEPLFSNPIFSKAHVGIIYWSTECRAKLVKQYVHSNQMISARRQYAIIQKCLPKLSAEFKAAMTKSYLTPDVLHRLSLESRTTAGEKKDKNRR